MVCHKGPNVPYENDRGREGGSKDFVVLKLQPVNLKRFLAVANRYQHGQVHLTTKGQFDSWE